MHSSTSGSLQHIASAVRWCSRFIQINASTTLVFFFFCGPLVSKFCIYMCMCVSTCTHLKQLLAQLAGNINVK